MAIRGKPIPFEMRTDVKNRRCAGDSLRKIARAIGLSVNTVRKYASKFDTDSLQHAA